MRTILAAVTFAACFVASYVVDLPQPHAAASIAQKQANPKKPPPSGGNDSCRYANDHECDEPDIGTGACRVGTDASDCRYLRTGERDACRFARDGECDEPNFGSGACTQGSDLTDCGQIAWMRNDNDSCDTAFNGVCEEPGHGNGSCAARTDRADCHGRDRPMTIFDHFFGHDDRVLVDPKQFPWRTIGVLTLDGGESCTATLIANDVVITASHCIHPDNHLNAHATFRAAEGYPGGPYEARVIAYYYDPRFNVQAFENTNDIDGTDWAMLRLDHPLGRFLGHVGVENLTGQGSPATLAADIYQAGFGWDTGSHLAANLRCHIVRVQSDNTVSHQCDTTRGDSGSALMVRHGDQYAVVGVDSNFRPVEHGPAEYIAVSAASFQRYVDDFVAGRIGRTVGGDKPKK